MGWGLGGAAGAGKYETGTTAPADLDLCNGHVGDVPEDAEYGFTAGSVYHYHMTDHFPHTIGCFGPVADEVWRTPPRASSAAAGGRRAYQSGALPEGTVSATKCSDLDLRWHVIRASLEHDWLRTKHARCWSGTLLLPWGRTKRSSGSFMRRQHRRGHRPNTQGTSAQRSAQRTLCRQEKKEPYSHSQLFI